MLLKGEIQVCVNNLGEVDKYRYSVALVELGFGTDAARPAGPV